MAKRYYSPAEVAEALSVSTSTVLRLIHEGRLPAIRVSERIYRIPVPALDRFQSGAAPPNVTAMESRAESAPRLGAGERLPRRRRIPAVAG